MSISRYRNDVPMLGGRIRSTHTAMKKIRQGIKNGSIATKQIVLREGERLDHIATRYYGDGRYWWVLAAASNIGWWMQAPPETIVRIPDLAAVLEVV